MHYAVVATDAPLAQRLFFVFASIFIVGVQIWATVALHQEVKHPACSSNGASPVECNPGRWCDQKNRMANSQKSQALGVTMDQPHGVCMDCGDYMIGDAEIKHPELPVGTQTFRSGSDQVDVVPADEFPVTYTPQAAHSEFSIQCEESKEGESHRKCLGDLIARDCALYYLNSTALVTKYAHWDVDEIDTMLAMCDECQGRTHERRIPQMWTGAERDRDVYVSMRPGEWWMCFMIALMVSLGIGGEIRDVKFSEMSQRAAHAASTDGDEPPTRAGFCAPPNLWHFALDILAIVRQYTLVPLLSSAIGIIIVRDGTNAKNVALNAIAILFILELDVSVTPLRAFCSVTLHHLTRNLITEPAFCERHPR